MERISSSVNGKEDWHSEDELFLSIVWAQQKQE